MKALVIIPARGGSKGIPKKNIKLLHNKPLIHYTLEAARQVFEDQDICVSTDDENIKQVVEAQGLKVPFLRPEFLATDNAGSYEVILHAIDYYYSLGREYDTVVLLQPTSPFRTEKHIKEAINLYKDDIDMVVSVKETDSNPYYVLFEEDENGFLKKSKESFYKRRQDCPKVWEYNGAIYVINVKTLKKRPVNQFDKVVKYQMSKISSIDIDEPIDWLLAEAVLSNNANDKKLN